MGRSISIFTFLRVSVVNLAFSIILSIRSTFS